MSLFFFLSSEMRKMEEIKAPILIIENKRMFRLYSEIEFLQQIKAGYLILEHMEDWVSGRNQHIANVPSCKAPEVRILHLPQFIFYKFG